MKVETSTGFSCEIDDDILDDWELIDAYADVSDRKPFAETRIPKIMLSDDDLKKLKDHCRNPKNGRVSREAMDKEVGEIMKQLGKNSSPSPTESQ